MRSLEIIHAQALFGFLTILNSSSLDLENPRVFCGIIESATKHYDIKPKEIADCSEQHVSTPGRWAKGKSLPQLVVRRLVVDWIRTQIQEQYERLKPTPEDLEEMDKLVKQHYQLKAA